MADGGPPSFPQLQVVIQQHYLADPGLPPKRPRGSKDTAFSWGVACVGRYIGAAVRRRWELLHDKGRRRHACGEKKMRLQVRPKPAFRIADPRLDLCSHCVVLGYV